jgi:checkpoint serine/threonine-protein kinase
LTEVYPTPEEPGTELSFEEIIAWNRGWLDRSWEEDSVDVNVVPGPAVMDDVYDMSNGICQKLVIHKDPILVDENNAVMERPQQPKGSRKKKIMDFNETQISMLCKSSGWMSLMQTSQSEVGLSIWTQTAQEKYRGTNYDDTYKSCHRRHIRDIQRPTETGRKRPG